MKEPTPKLLLCWLVLLVSHVICTNSEEEFERVPNDGWFNNLLHPDWGAIDTHLLRVSPANFSDGVYEPSGKDRPNPLEISKIAFAGENKKGSARNRNAMLVFFGQQMVEEIMDAQRSGCPIEYFNIKVPLGHKYNPHNLTNLEMPFQRARYDQRTGFSPNNPRQQINEITPYLDGTLIYGAGKAVEDALRSFKDGMLSTNDSRRDIKNSFPRSNRDIRLPFANPPSPRDHKLKPVTRFRRYANPRTHENPFLLTLATIWFRYHNYIARELKNSHTDWNDEQLFLAARKRVIGQYQKIVMYDWLPRWLKIDEDGNQFNMADYPYEGGGKNKYAGYDPHVIPNIATEFQAAAMRFGHSLVPSGVYPLRITDKDECVSSERSVKARFSTKNYKDGDGDVQVKGIRLCNAFWVSELGFLKNILNRLKRRINDNCTIPTRSIKARFSTRKDGDGDDDVDVKGIRLCNAFWVSQETTEDHPESIDEMVRGMIYTKAAMEDNIIVSDIREDVFGTLDWSRRDLGALNIQRGRDMGLPGYNKVREAYGLKRISSWGEINNSTNVSNTSIFTDLRELYNKSEPDDLDLFPGGLLETTHDGPGDLFRTIILNQFLRIRHGDRFWYENKQAGIYNDTDIDKISRTTFFDVLKVTTDFYNQSWMPHEMDVFSCGGIKFSRSSGNSTADTSKCQCREPDFETEDRLYQIKIKEHCVDLKHYDYFQGSEAAYIITVIAVLLSLPGAIGLMLLLVRLRHSSLSNKATESQNLPPTGPGEFYATEWIGRTSYGLLDSRTVLVTTDSNRHKLNVMNLKGQAVRVIDLRVRIKEDGEKPKAYVTRSGDKGHKLMMLSKPGEIDLVGITGWWDTETDKLRQSLTTNTSTTGTTGCWYIETDKLCQSLTTDTSTTGTTGCWYIETDKLCQSLTTDTSTTGTTGCWYIETDKLCQSLTTDTSTTGTTGCWYIETDKLCQSLTTDTSTTGITGCWYIETDKLCQSLTTDTSTTGTTGCWYIETDKLCQSLTTDTSTTGTTGCWYIETDKLCQSLTTDTSTTGTTGCWYIETDRLCQSLTTDTSTTGATGCWYTETDTLCQSLTTDTSTTGTTGCWYIETDRLCQSLTTDTSTTGATGCWYTETDKLCQSLTTDTSTTGATGCWYTETDTLCQSLISFKLNHSFSRPTSLSGTTSYRQLHMDKQAVNHKDYLIFIARVSAASDACTSSICRKTLAQFVRFIIPAASDSSTSSVCRKTLAQFIRFNLPAASDSYASGVCRKTLAQFVRFNIPAASDAYTSSICRKTLAQFVRFNLPAASDAYTSSICRKTV
ncbi:hypothetical protein RRG08_013796 [Elysia crispata]|uniref:Peroxidase n=1 Tax=Elysia crispata TaxID=231223 RepID=A0AAE1BBF5_9GAST|nr:hypothetical protein RRG08_013796 [Elysia crispata]